MDFQIHRHDVSFALLENKKRQTFYICRIWVRRLGFALLNGLFHPVCLACVVAWFAFVVAIFMGHENGDKQRPAERWHLQGMLDETDLLDSQKTRTLKSVDMSSQFRFWPIWNPKMRTSDHCLWGLQSLCGPWGPRYRPGPWDTLGLIGLKV